MAFDACMARLQRHLAADVAARSAVENRMTAARLKHDQLVARARVTLELRMASVPRVRAVVRVDLGARPPGKKKRGPEGGEPMPVLPRPKPLPLMGGAEAPLD